MTLRGDSAFQNEGDAEVNLPIYLVKIELKCSIDYPGLEMNEPICSFVGGDWTAPIYLTDYLRPITWDGKVWASAGSLLSVGGIQETIDLQISGITIALSGVDQSVVSLILSKQYIDRPVSVYQSFITDGQLTIEPVEIFRGYIDAPSIKDSPKTSTVSLSVRNHFSDFQKLNGRHTNSAEQKHLFPGDTSMRHCSNALDEVRWGSDSAQ